MSIKTVKGKYNTIEMVDPEKCFFIAHYEDGNTIKGNNLLDTGWAGLKDGIIGLQYYISTGLLINIPRFKEYLHLVEVSQSLETGNKIFHSVNIKGKQDNHVINYKIILKQDKKSKNKIGDILVTKEDSVMESPFWKTS